MSSRDIQTVKGILTEFQSYLEIIRQADVDMIHALKQNKFLENDAEALWKKLSTVYRNVKKKLEKGILDCEKAKERVNKGGLAEKELEQIIEPLDFFIKRIWYSEKGGFLINPTEYDLINDFLKKMEDQGFDEQYKKIVKNRIFALSKFYNTNKRFYEINKLKENIKSKVSLRIRIKRKRFSLKGRPKIDEVVEIGKTKVHLNIFYSKELSEQIIANHLEKAINSVQEEFNDTLDGKAGRLFQGMHPGIGLANTTLSLQKTFRQNVMNIKDLDIREIEELWLKKLKDMVLTILNKNPDLLKTTNVGYQLQVGPDSGGVAFCRTESTLDNYLFGIDISTLLGQFLMCKDFYESFPSDLFSNFCQLVNKPIFYAPNLNAPKGQNNKPDEITKNFSIVQQLAVNYRTFSLYNTFSHETQHAADAKVLDQMANMNLELMTSLFEKNYFKKHMILNLDPEILTIFGFFQFCRQEAVPQFREFIVANEKLESENKAYSLVNPIPTLGKFALIDAVNKLLTSFQDKKFAEKNLIQHYPDFKQYGYALGHMMNMTIFIADCLKKQQSLIIIDEGGYQRLLALFPYAAPTLIGHTKMVKIPEGRPEKKLLETITSGTTEEFVALLKYNQIPIANHQHIATLIETNTPFYIFRPSMDVAKETLRKLDISNYETYLQLYENACNILGLEEKLRLITINKLGKFAKTYYNAKAKLIKEAGYKG